VWAWFARNPELSAFSANAHFRGPSSVTVGPCWCGSRFGQSRTPLADGRVVAIGGERHRAAVATVGARARRWARQQAARDRVAAAAGARNGCARPRADRHDAGGLGGAPVLELHNARFSPPVEHVAPNGGDVLAMEHRIVIDGATVHYVQDPSAVRIAVEGMLPQQTIDLVVDDVRRRLEALEKSPYTAQRLR
jgi:hypothetical protein